MVYTTQGEMLQGYLIVRVCDRCARARCVCTIDRADLRELYSVLSDPCAKNSYTRTRQPLCCAALRVALERLSGCTTTMFDESIPFLSAENALSAEQPKLRHAKTKRKKKNQGRARNVQATDQQRAQKSREHDRVARAAWRCAGKARQIYIHNTCMRSMGMGDEPQRQGARRAWRARRETHQYCGCGRRADSPLTRPAVPGTCAARWAATCVRARRAQVSVRGQSRQPGRPGADAARAMHARCPRPMQGQCMHAGGRRSSFGSGPLSAPRPAQSHAWRRHQARLAVA